MSGRLQAGVIGLEASALAPRTVPASEADHSRLGQLITPGPGLGLATASQFNELFSLAPALAADMCDHNPGAAVRCTGLCL